MIVPDNTPQSPLKSSSGQNLPESSNSNPESPPSYSAAQSQNPSVHSRLLPSHAGPSNIHYPTPPRRQSAARRFFEAFCVALLIWILVGLFLGTSINVRTTKRSRADYGIPGNMHLRSCIEGHNIPPAPSYYVPFSSQIENVTQPGYYPSFTYLQKSFELPLSSKTLFLLSRGDFQGPQGTRKFQLFSSPDLDVNVAKVDVIIGYYDKEVLPHTKVCLMSRNSKENGVGFFTHPLNDREQEWFYVDIRVTLPQSGFDPLLVKNFETDLPQFAHYLGASSDFVEFDQLSLKASNAFIDATSLTVHDQCTIQNSNGYVSLDSLAASNALVKNSNGFIMGTYDVTGSLTLQNSNAKIDVAVNLTSSKGQGELSIKNSNGPIEANVHLISAKAQQSENDRFIVSTFSSNGELKLNLLSLPYESALSLEAKTSNENARVKLPQTFEGQFTLLTSNSFPFVERVESRERDPAGRGRTRQVHYKSSIRTFLQGNVYWDEDHKSRSDVRVRSSNGKVVLFL